ncbi:MAG: hypothetical protein MR691_11115 [Clostridium sp.]|nr:hypothetical protein [Clostridium sp.]
MGLGNFKEDTEKKDNSLRESEIIKPPNKDYKSKTDKAISAALHKVNPFSISEKKSPDRVPMTIYFEKEYLDILKALAYTKKRTVNEILMITLQDLFDNTDFPTDFNIDTLSKKYDNTIKKVGRKKK